jgi:hypothetical protein
LYLGESLDDDMRSAALARLARTVIDELVRVEASRIEIFEAGHAALTLGERFAVLTESDNG